MSRRRVGLALACGLSLGGCWPPEAGSDDSSTDSRDDRPGQGGDAGAGGDWRGCGSGGGPGGGSAQGGGDTAGGGGSGDDLCLASWGGDLQLGGDLDDQALALVADPVGGLLLAGFQSGLTGVTNIDPSGNSFAFVTHFLPTGQSDWSEVIDTPGTDTVESMAFDATHGEVLVAGRTSGALAGSFNQGQFDAYLAVLGKDGAQLVLHQMGRERPEHPTAVAPGPGESVVMAGYDDIFVPSNYVESWEDGFIANLTVDHAAGHDVEEQPWLRSSSPGSDVITALAVAAEEQGAVYVGGTSPGGSGGGPFVKKVGPDGTVLWSHVLSPLAIDGVGAIGLSPQGDLIVTGTSFSQLGAKSYGQQDVFVLRLDRTTGDTMWAYQGGSTESDWATSLAFNAAGHVFVAGVTPGVLAPGHTPRGGLDVFVVELDLVGEPLWSWQTGTDQEDWASSVAVDACGRVFLAGYTEGAIVEGGAYGGRDAFLLAVPR